MFHIYLNQVPEANKLMDKFLEPSAIAAVVAAFVAFYSVYLNSRNFKNQQIESERKEIYKKLNKFYGPMRMLLKTSKEFSVILKQGKANLKRDDENRFRILTYLLRGKEFDKTDDALLRKIILDGKKIEKIIINNAGLIDDDGLSDDTGLRLSLNQLLRHIRLIRMAHENKFESGVDKDRPFDGYVFPIVVNYEIDKKFYQLKLRLEILNKNNDKEVQEDLKTKINESNRQIEELTT